MKLSNKTPLMLTFGLLAALVLAGCDSGVDNTSEAPAPAPAPGTETAPIAPATTSTDVVPGAAADASVVPASYPLTTCVVSGEALGSMGDPIRVTHEGRDVYLCCKGCVEDFKENAASYIAKLDAAAAAAATEATDAPATDEAATP